MANQKWKPGEEAPEDAEYTAYDENGKMLALKAADTTTTLNSETPDGVNTLTFAPEFTAEVNEAAVRYKVFMLDSLTSAVPVYKSVKVSK